jgi:hypothetical protein
VVKNNKKNRLLDGEFVSPQSELGIERDIATHVPGAGFLAPAN